MEDQENCGHIERTQIYIVKEQFMENSVHVVYPESGDKQKTRTLHCNLLLLVNDLPVEVPPHSVTSISEKRTQKGKSWNQTAKTKELAALQEG